MFKIKKVDRDAIINYLASRPYAEVAKAIEVLATLEAIKTDEVLKEAPKTE